MQEHDHTACLWHALPRKTRERICKNYGFGDWKLYAGYLWEHFQPHTREALAPLVQLEADAATGFNRAAKYH